MWALFISEQGPHLYVFSVSPTAALLGKPLQAYEGSVLRGPARGQSGAQ